MPLFSVASGQQIVSLQIGLFGLHAKLLSIYETKGISVSFEHNAGKETACRKALNKLLYSISHSIHHLFEHSKVNNKTVSIQWTKGDKNNESKVVERVAFFFNLPCYLCELRWWINKIVILISRDCLL